MKTFCLIGVTVFTIAFSISCRSKTQAEQTAAAITQTTQASASSDEIPGGAFLKATIDGKAWEANKITPDLAAGSDYKRVTAEKGGTSIGFQIWKPTTGKKMKFDDDHAADLWLDSGIFGGRKGEVTITSVSDGWMEGSFYFTATTQQSSETHEVTNGSFRVPIGK